MRLSTIIILLLIALSFYLHYVNSSDSDHNRRNIKVLFEEKEKLVRTDGFQKEISEIWDELRKLKYEVE